MTDLPRVTLSLPPDIVTEIKRMKACPEFQRLPKSKILIQLIRLGMEKK